MIILLVWLFSSLSAFCQDNYILLKGTTLLNGLPAPGITLSFQGTLNQSTSQEKGHFEIQRDPSKDSILVITPCCTDLCATTILVEDNVKEIKIDCICKTKTRTSRIHIIKYYSENNKLIKRQEKFKICK